MESPKKLYSKLAIILFSAIGSTLFGALLYCENLRVMKKGKYILPVIISAFIYSFLLLKASNALGFKIFYGYIPVHLLGGFLLAGPIWKHQFGYLQDYTKRNITVPLIVLVLLFGLLLTIPHVFYKGDSLSKNYKEKVVQSINNGMQNEIFVSKDSAVQFFDLTLPLLDSSFFNEVSVDNDHSLINNKQFSDGNFCSICLRLQLSEKEEFNQKLLGKNFSFLKIEPFHSDEFDSIIYADYSRDFGDTIRIYGKMALIKAGRVVYHYSTQYAYLDSIMADSISDCLIQKIHRIK